jgi:hypothetical protein
MDSQVTIALIAAGVTLLTTFVPLWLKYTNESKKHAADKKQADEKAETFVSTGLAVGYYYNFIKPVFERLQATDEIRISINKKGADEEESQRSFKTDNVDIQIIIPAELTVPAINAARDYARMFRKGSILRKNGERDFAIQLSIEDSNDRLIIQDVANPLNAVRQYVESLEEFKSVFTDGGAIIDRTNSQKFRDRQRKEIDNFVNALKYFTKKEGYADKKISFKPL